ncbi:MAG: hypothetical protein WEB59_03800 [Thermoanaerobaculia bacterium]
MGQTRMFRDRVVSMEQTLEGGEKHLPLLRELCREALPEHEFREHSLDHERDLFVMDFGAPDGSRRRICWTRMVLYDAERIPTLTGDPAAALRGKIVELIRGNANRPEIVVTFRHLEEGWVDTPEPRREGRRRRRGGKSGGRGPERGGPAPARRAQQPGSPRGGPARGGPQPAPRGTSAPRPSGPQRPPSPQRGPGPPRPSSPAAQASPEDGAGAPGGKRRRRFRRRRRGGRGTGGGGAAPGPGSAPPAVPGA